MSVLNGCYCNCKQDRSPCCMQRCASMIPLQSACSQRSPSWSCCLLSNPAEGDEGSKQCNARQQHVQIEWHMNDATPPPPPSPLPAALSLLLSRGLSYLQFGDVLQRLWSFPAFICRHKSFPSLQCSHAYKAGWKTKCTSRHTYLLQPCWHYNYC